MLPEHLSVTPHELPKHKQLSAPYSATREFYAHQPRPRYDVKLSRLCWFAGPSDGPHFLLVRRLCPEPTSRMQNTHQARPRYDIKMSRLCGLAQVGWASENATYSLHPGPYRVTPVPVECKSPTYWYRPSPPGAFRQDCPMPPVAVRGGGRYRRSTTPAYSRIGHWNYVGV